MKKIFVFLTILVVGLLTVKLAYATNVNENDNKIKICHATSSENNPYIVNNPNKSGDVSGHDNHNGGIFPADPWGDIIPPFVYFTTLNLGHGIHIQIPHNYSGKNWTSEGQTIWNNDCEIPEQEVTPTPTPTIEPCDGKCEPTPTPTEEPRCTENCGNPPTFAGSSTEAPQCGAGETTNVVANPHVLRTGSDATVNFFITEGDSANIYWSVVGQPHWGNAVSDVKPNSDNFVSYTIHDLDPNLGYDFGIQQKQGCGGGKTTAVIVDGPVTKLFQFSYWE